VRWRAFVVFACVALILEVSLRNTLRLDSLRGTSPSFVAILATFVLLFAPRLSALWACWILGVLLDLLPPPDGEDVRIIGPMALGLVFAGLVVLPLRTMVFRRRSITIGVMTVIVVMASSIAAVFVLIVRHWMVSDPTHTVHGMSALLHQGLVALYSGAVAWPLGWLLLQSMPLWGFQTTSQRRR
jgi:cell shape-determining protein MreD